MNAFPSHIDGKSIPPVNPIGSALKAINSFILCNESMHVVSFAKKPKIT